MKKRYSIILGMILMSMAFSPWAIGQNVPVVAGFSPSSGYACEVISVSGYNFDADVKVFFGAVEGSVVNATDQLIEVEVPTGATFDHIMVLNPTGRRVGYSRNKFLPSFGSTTGIASNDFAAQVDLTVNTGLFDVCLCDLNGDGNSDIITTSSTTNKVDILLNNSTPSGLSFSRREITMPGSTLNVTCGDLNGDGKQDLVFSEGNDGERLFILQNNSTTGSLSFAPQSYNIPGSSTKRVGIRDLDQDGRADIVVTDQSLPNVYIIKNVSNGAISLNPSFGTLNVAGANSTAGLAIDDFDGDKRPDILVTQFLNGNGGFFVSLNRSTTNSPSFSGFDKFNAPGALFNIISARINNDTRPDIAGSQFTENMMSLFGNTSSVGASGFTGPSYVPTGLRPWGIDGADFDGDGMVDFVLATTGSSLAVSIMNGAGSGVFTHTPIKATYINRNVQAGDINGDGKPDIVISSVDDQANAIPASRVSIFLNEKCHVPVIEPEGPLTYCSGFTEFLRVACIPGATYDWKVDGTTVQNGASNEFETTVSGQYTVSVTIGSCTTTSAPVDVTIKSGTSLPTALITANSPVCAGQTLNLSSSDVGATTYEWTGPDGYTASGRNVSISDFALRNAGRYFVDIYSGDCLIQTESVLVEATPAPEFTVVTSSGTSEFCAGETATLQVQPGVSGFDYQWYDQNGSISGATNASYNATTAGDYYVEITDQVSGCPTINTDVISIGFVAAPIAEFEAPSGVCANSPVIFNNISTDNGSANYLWNFDDGTVSTEASPTHTFTTQRTYDVSLTVNYGDASCQDVITKQIVVADGLTVEMNIGDVTICEGETVILSPLGTYADYTWQDGSKESTYEVTTTGTYTVSVRDAGGCEGEVSSIVTVNGVPNVVITATPEAVPPGEPVQLSVSGLMSYEWEPAALLDDPNIASPIAVLEETTIFTVSGQTDTGCRASGEIRVIVSGDLIGQNLHPKNFFSPNDGDMINATWEIDGIDEYPDCLVEVFDQVGNQIFEAKPYLNNWDGTSGGQMVPDGAYYYVITLDGKPVKSGSVTLLRN